MADHIDKEIEAIKVVLGVLEPLPSNIRVNVLQYVIGRLQIVLDVKQLGESNTPAAPPPPPQQGAQIHIKGFKEQKKPHYAVEMAAVAAFYLQNLAPSSERKDRISTRDLETYFKIAEFKLPTKPQFTLPNAKAAGYFDAVGNGEYKLNAVGHNLVAHSLPRGKETSTSRRSAPKRK